MPYIPGQLSQQKQVTQQTGKYIPGSLSKKKKEEEKAPSITDIEGLKAFAESKGVKAKKEKKGLFRRTIEEILKGRFQDNISPQCYGENARRGTL